MISNKSSLKSKNSNLTITLKSIKGIGAYSFGSINMQRKFSRKLEE